MALEGPFKLTAAILLALCANAVSVRGGALGEPVPAANSQTADETKASGSDQSGVQNKDDKREKTPEEKMLARFPQPTRVGHLIGLPILDYDDSTIGYVREVVRTPDGKVRLIVPYGKRFGWARDWWPFDVGRRTVAVPIETVSILALQIDALDMVRGDFDKAPTWSQGQDKPLLPDDMVKIALSRR